MWSNKLLNPEIRKRTNITFRNSTVRGKTTSHKFFMSHYYIIILNKILKSNQKLHSGVKYYTYAYMVKRKMMSLL